ncbi:MAG: MmcQ/YjbR family DNA-binding protein [Bacteroidia bacterium]
MNSEELRDYCLTKQEVTESFPFGSDTLVFKVCGKIFLLCSLSSNPLQFNVKSDPEKITELREQYDCVLPGYHMNKRHWNTIIIDGSVSKQQLQKWINESYRLIILSLPKTVQKNYFSDTNSSL